MLPPPSPPSWGLSLVCCSTASLTTTGVSAAWRSAVTPQRNRGLLRSREVICIEKPVTSVHELHYNQTSRKRRDVTAQGKVLWGQRVLVNHCKSHKRPETSTLWVSIPKFQCCVLWIWHHLTAIHVFFFFRLIIKTKWLKFWYGFFISHHFALIFLRMTF